MKLQKIAEEMIRYAVDNPYSGGDMTAYRRELPRGLTITYIDAGQKRLALSRQGVAPSEFEEGICRRAFNAPAEAERQAVVKGNYYHITITWPVAVVAKLSETTAPFLAGATYMLAGSVYRAHQVKQVWLLSDLNKTFGDKFAGAFYGYALRKGRLYRCEYYWRDGRVHWPAKPEPANNQVSDFVRCGVIVRKIDLDWRNEQLASSNTPMGAPIAKSNDVPGYIAKINGVGRHRQEQRCGPASPIMTIFAGVHSQE